MLPRIILGEYQPEPDGKNETGDRLIIKKVNATAYWKDVFSNYNKFSRDKVDTDLSAYATEKAMSGIFHSIAQEELKIRKDPAARVTDLLKKVFN